MLSFSGHTYEVVFKTVASSLPNRNERALHPSSVPEKAGSLGLIIAASSTNELTRAQLLDGIFGLGI